VTNKTIQIGKEVIAAGQFELAIAFFTTMIQANCRCIELMNSGDCVQGTRL